MYLLGLCWILIRLSGEYICLLEIKRWLIFTSLLHFYLHMLNRNALEATQTHMSTWTHTPKRHTFYFNLAMLTLHSFPQCVKPLAAVSSWALASHTTQWGLDASMQLWPCWYWNRTRTTPVVPKKPQDEIHTEEELIELEQCLGKSFWREWVKNTSFTEKRRDGSSRRGKGAWVQTVGYGF